MQTLVRAEEGYRGRGFDLPTGLPEGLSCIPHANRTIHGKKLGDRKDAANKRWAAIVER
jgi:hypothetical protein